MGAALSIQNLEFSYVPGVPVLKVPFLRIERGEKVFVYGPSGCGKTTFLGLIVGVLNLQLGELSLLDEPMHRLSPRLRDRFRGVHVGYIFQMFNLIPYLNVRENIVLPCHLNPQRAARLGGTMEREVEALADSLGIADLLDRRTTDLSVGQQQRVAAARALLGRPEIIVADEPTSALDSEHRRAFLDVLLAQAGKTGATVLFVSHDHALAAGFDRTLSVPEINRVGSRKNA